MAIGYIGIPGSGKSHDLVQNVIIPELQAGKRVFTNIPLNTGNMTRIHKLTAKQINNLTMIPDEVDETGKLIQPIAKLLIPSEDKEFNLLIGSVLVMDEVQTSLPFDERRSNPELKRMRDFVSHHRHYDVEWHWASQSEHLVDVTLRRLTDTVYLFKNLKHSTRGKLVKYGAYRRRLYMMTDGEVDKEMITEDVTDVKPHTFMCYKSFVGNDVAGKFKAPIPRFLRNGIIIASILAGIVIPYTTYKTWTWYKKITTKPGQQTKQEAKQNENQNTGNGIDIANRDKGGKHPIEYDGFFSIDRGGQIVHLLLRNGQTVYECNDPLFSFASTTCGFVSVNRVARTSLSDGLGNGGATPDRMSGMDAPQGAGQ